MAKFKIGTVDLTTVNSDSGNYDGVFVVGNGKLSEPAPFETRPRHDVSTVELPDGAIPFCVISLRGRGDRLAWYMPV